MDVDFINSYLQRANEIIGERTAAEIEYDDAVVEHFGKSKNIQNAIAVANRQFPNEALRPKEEHWDDIYARYHYIREHKEILKKLGMKETF